MRLYFAFFSTLFSICINAQSVFNAELIKKLDSGLPNDIVNVLVLHKAETKIDLSSISSLKLHYQVGNISAVSCKLKSVTELSRLKNIIRIEYTQHHLQLMDDTCVSKNRIKAIKQGLSPLPQAYDGSGVIVGIIDSGTDFNHPDFKDINGNSRIKYLWDMTKPVAANTPTAFGYGQEWTHTQIDQGLCTHTDMAHYGHGTNAAGIAAGNGYSINKYEGMAPKADIIVVALDFNRPGFTIADAVQYIVSKSQLLNKPLVINASVGDYYGSHDGTDLEAQLIDNMMKNAPGRALVAACGNGGGAAFHIGYNIVSTDTNFTWIRNNSSIINLSEYADTNQIKNVKYSISVTNPGFNDIGQTPFQSYNYALNTLKKDTIFKNGNRIGIVQSIASINSFGVYELSISIKADSLNYYWGIAHTGTGKIDSWNFDYVTTGLPSTIQYPKIAFYKKADTLQTIVSSFQCSNEVIAVGNYINRNSYVDVNNVTQTNSEVAGQLHPSSSIGPTRDNRIKPDITASGATILASSPLAHIFNLKTNAPYLVAQGGFHVTAGGTSSSSPVVAGLAALYLQRHPTATNQQIKQAIISCAYQDVYTGASLPNNTWGYGKLDGFAAMWCGEILESVNELGLEKSIEVYPNPMINETNVLFPNQNPKTIKLYNASGQLVFEDTCETSNYSLKRNQLATGLYLLLCEEKTSSYKIKIIIL